MAVMRGCDGSLKVGSNTLGYIDSFSINTSVGSSETSSIGKEWKEFIATVKEWSGSASGTFDYGDSGQKELVDKILGTGDAKTKFAAEFKVNGALTVTGNINITGAAINASHGDKVSISFNFQGTDALTAKAGA